MDFSKVWCCLKAVNFGAGGVVERRGWAGQGTTADVLGLLGGVWLTAGSRPQAVPEAIQPGSGSVVSTGMGVRWEADPTLRLDAEPNPVESRPQSDFQFLDYQDPSDMLPGLGDGGGPVHLMSSWTTVTGVWGATRRRTDPCQLQFSHTAESWAPGGAQRIAREGRMGEKDFGNVL